MAIPSFCHSFLGQIFSTQKIRLGFIWGGIVEKSFMDPFALQLIILIEEGLDGDRMMDHDTDGDDDHDTRHHRAETILFL